MMGMMRFGVTNAQRLQNTQLTTPIRYGSGVYCPVSFVCRAISQNVLIGERNKV